MIKLLKIIILYTIAFIAIAGLLPANSHAEYGATIPYTNCNPGADPALDYLKTTTDVADGTTYYPTKSCVGQGISLTSKTNPFKVKVSFIPDAAFISAYVLTNLAALIPLYSKSYYGAKYAAFSAAMSSCVGSCLFCAGLCTPGAEIAGQNAGIAAVIIELTINFTLSLTNAVGADSGISYINVGSTVPLLEGPLGPVASAEARIEGDHACVYMQALPIPFINFIAERTGGFNRDYNINSDSSLASKKNCVTMPALDTFPKPEVPGFISQACIDYDASASEFRFPPAVAGGRGKSRSFTGVVVQCVQETMMNLFFNVHQGDTQTIFQKIQLQLKTMILAMMALYIVLFGYKYIMYHNDGMKQKDFIWPILKIAFVFYFALGSGFIGFFPSIINSIQTYSAIVINAASSGTSYDSSGKAINQQEAANDLTTTLDAYKLAQTNYSNARKAWGLSPTDDNLEDMINKKEIMDEADSVYQNANIVALSYGYDYCNFKPFAEAGKYTHTYQDENGNSVTKDMSYMQLWDAIDCRISKYLGLGADKDSPSTPFTLMIAMGSVGFGIFVIIILFAIAMMFFCGVFDAQDEGGYGGYIILASIFPIALAVSTIVGGGVTGLFLGALIIVFLIFIIFIIVRIVHIYVVAYVILTLLAYVAPLAIPMMLFEYTKSSAENWLKQFIGYCVQPIILFTFLAFMFAIFDNVIYGDNHNFNPLVKTDLYNEPSLNDNTIMRHQNNYGKWVCEDESAIGCMFEEIGVEEKYFTIEGAQLFPYYTLYRKSNMGEYIYPTPGSSDSTTSNGGYLSQLKYGMLVVEMLKIIFVCYVVNALLEQIEGISSTMTNIVASAAQFSSSPSTDPGSIAKATVSPAAKMAGKGAATAMRPGVKMGIKAASDAGKAAMSKMSGGGNKAESSKSDKGEPK